MPWRIAQLLQRGLPHVPDPLLSPAARARLASVPDALPPCLEAAAFECRLDGADDRVDFMVGTYAGPGQQGLLRSRARGHFPTAPPAPWKPGLDLLDRWSDPADALYSSLGEIWFEFDIDGRGETPPLFTFLSPLVRGRPARPDQSRAVVGLLDEILGVLGQAPRTDTRHNLQACVGHLPRWGRLLQCAPLAHRRPDTYRLVLSVPTDRVLAWLDRVGWSGDREGLRQLLLATGAPAFRPRVQLDVDGEGPLPHLSLEFSAPGRLDERWQPLLDHVYDECGMSGPRARCLADWPGDPTLIPRRGDPVQVARLLQVKLSIDARGRQSAKAYLGYRPQVVLFW